MSYQMFQNPYYMPYNPYQITPFVNAMQQAYNTQQVQQPQQAQQTRLNVYMTGLKKMQKTTDKPSSLP